MSPAPLEALLSIFLNLFECVIGVESGSLVRCERSCSNRLCRRLAEIVEDNRDKPLELR